MLALPISKPRFKGIVFFIKIALKLSYFCKNCKIFERLVLCFQTPMPPAAWGFAPKPIFAYAPARCRRYRGARGAVPPIATACAPPFRFTQNTFLEHHAMTTDNNGTRNNNVQRQFSFEARMWKRKLEAVKVVNFLWKRKRFDERGWKRKQTRKRKC